MEASEAKAEDVERPESKGEASTGALPKKKKKKSEETISVHLRLKPTRKDPGYLRMDSMDSQIVRLNIPERGVTKEKGYVNNSKTNYNFKFNSVIPMEAKQDDVFDKIGKDAVLNVLEGFNSTVFAYGQTGSGKTFTITGGVDSYEQRGLIPRTISMMFSEFSKRSDMTYSLHVAYLEIYNNDGFDLLDQSHGTKALEDLPRVTMMEDEDGNCHLRNLSMHRANNEEDALNLLFLGDTNRAIAETPMNMASSRSHCIFTLFVEGRRMDSDSILRSKLHLVDLAGSERVHKTHASGQTLREAGYINSSLFFLEMVIVALHEKATKHRGHIPYRNSMMTSVLRDSLGGNCKTLMVATVSVESDQIEETISTCKFAQRVALIKNSAIVNEDLDPTVMIQRLQGQITNLRDEITYLKGESGEGGKLSEEEIAELQQAIHIYVDSKDPYATLQIGKLTLTKLKDAFAIFKNLILDARGKASGTADAEEVTELREKLQQRDQEIAILVNMVKQAKGKLSARRGTPNSSTSTASLSADSKSTDASSWDVKPEGKDPSSAGRYLAVRTVKGVNLTADPHILADAKTAFDHFKNACPRSGAIEENKAVLKDKFSLAKSLAERVNSSRSKINYLKQTIEQLRRERAMEREGLLEGDSQAEEESEEEKGHMEAIEREKVTYKESFQELRDLKSEIEHIQQMLKKGTTKLQQEFDEWYNACLHDEAKAAVRGTPVTAPLPSQPQSSPPVTGHKDADEDIREFYKAKEELERLKAQRLSAAAQAKD